MGIQIEDAEALLDSLCALPRETDWVEFKVSTFNPENIGKYVSALGNSAMFHEKDHAYMVFGIADETHEVVGTNVGIDGQKIGTDRFLFWLANRLDPRVNVQHHNLNYKGKPIELLCIDPAYQRPIKFKEQAYIRMDSAQQPLSKYPEIERAIWQITSRYSFETTTVQTNVKFENVDEEFDYKKLLELLKKNFESSAGAMSALEDLGTLTANLQTRYNVHALLPLTCAKDLNKFTLLNGRGARVIVYKGQDKLIALSDVEGQKGYAVSFEALMKHVLDKMPSEEYMAHGIRRVRHMLPELTIREFLANALIHQDFTVTGGRPVVEIYSDKVRIINPGVPLVDPERFIDTPSKSRNPRFAKLMRDAGLCEQRGSGVDRALSEIEKAALPPPLIQSVEGSTVVTVYMKKPFANLSAEDRIRACYQHACLMYEQSERMSNATLRTRFGLATTQISQVSKVISDSIEDGKIRPLNDDQANRNARYVPYWA